MVWSSLITVGLLLKINRFGLCLLTVAIPFVVFLLTVDWLLFTYGTLAHQFGFGLFGLGFPTVSNKDDL